MRTRLLSILSALYIATIIFLIWKLYDIKKRPAKYSTIPGYAEYQRSVYYWRIGREYGKNDLPGNVWPSTFYLYFIIPFWWFINLEQINLIGVDNAVESFVYSHPFIYTMYLIGSIWFAMIVASYLALFSTKPRDIAFSIFGMNSLFSQPKKCISRLEIWKKWTIITLITLLIAFPIRLRVLSCGGYIDDSKLVFTSHLGIQTQVYNFDDIVVEKLWDDQKNKYEHYWIINSLGERFDLCNSYIAFIDDFNFDVIGYIETANRNVDLSA